MCGALRNLVPFLQFKKCENTHGGVLILAKLQTSDCKIFLNCTNGTKSLNASYITIENLKFRPIISKIGTYTYYASKVLSDYLKPLCQNEYKINVTQSFASHIKEQPPLNKDVEYVSYNADYLYINIPVQESIDSIIHQIYTKTKLLHNCSQIIFRRLSLEVTTECSFQLKKKLYKQTKGCSMGGPLSVTLTDIHMIRTKNDVVKPLKQMFYKRYIDDIYSRREIKTVLISYIMD